MLERTLEMQQDQFKENRIWLDGLKAVQRFEVTLGGQETAVIKN
jgi:hypothetical protein